MKHFEIIQIIVAIIIIYFILRLTVNENLCVSKSYGVVTDVPVSSLRYAGSALVKDDSLGQAPLGDPRFWIGPTSPITQGQYGLYLEPTPLDKVNDFNPNVWKDIAEQRQVYTLPLPSQNYFNN